MDEINATLSIMSGISATIQEAPLYIDAEVTPSNIYGGDYAVESSFDDITLYTKNKFMSNNIEVKAIPMSEVSNKSGGYTINIGG